ncbi:hypothetical protein FPZ12_016280 [Amycolatopsis acidicola]|uniref:Cupin domain-containing protein n=1 Tax=Amycolatopsis acidicola TaxID=2596893 RepID=A0A5N0V406_9PSEU|nr:hypothetical protein [Amycolatopsis acidicola]KAA9160705.1 hypothetical protein FPZ12_016280 [Amycolatopsis acidicola]
MRSKINPPPEKRDLDLGFETGFGIEFAVSGKTTGSKKIVMGYTLMPPGARNQAHVHNNVEVIWHLLSGHNTHLSGSEETNDFKSTDCDPGTFGYVGKGEIHVGINRSDTEPGEVIFCYAGTNEKEGAGTVWVDPPSVVVEHLAARGLTLDELDLETRT